MSKYRPVTRVALCLALAAGLSASVPPGSPQAYRAGLEALASGRTDEAARHFESVRGPLESWAQLRRAQALLAKGNVAGAAALLRGDALPEAGRGMALRTLAACQTRVAMAAEAARTLEQALREPSLASWRATDRLTLAEYWNNAAEPAKAYLTLLEAAEQPGESTAAKRELKQKLLDAHRRGRVALLLPASERVRWARFLASNGLVSEAVATLSETPLEVNTDTCKIAITQARYESQLGRRDVATIRLNSVIESPRVPPSCKSEALLTLARVQLAGRDNESARVSYLRLIALEPDSARSATARVELAALCDSTKRADEAASLRRHVLEKQPHTASGGELTWETARQAHEKKQHAEAARLYGLFLKHHASNRLAPTARYWEALQRSLAGKDKAPLRELAQDRSLGIFQVLAATRATSGKPRFIRPSMEWSGASPRALPELRALPTTSTEEVARGLHDAGAWEELALLLEHGRKKFPADFAVRFGLVRVYEKLGQHKAALQVAEETSGSAARMAEGDRRQLDLLLHPVPFETQFVDACSEQRVSPYLALAIAREESRFQPDNRSWADARGLMQILPSTAHWMTSKFGIAGYAPERLYEPDYNIRLGVRYIAYLLDMFKGKPNQEVLVMAAYNGGPGNVRKWLRLFPNAPLDDFIERIPLEETRFYIKKVAASVLAYERLYGGGATPASIAPPPAGR